jgi:hypothetical protein
MLSVLIYQVDHVKVPLERRVIQALRAIREIQVRR